MAFAPSKVMNSSLTCDTMCDFVTLIFSVTSQGRDLRIFYAPFLWTAVTVQSLFGYLFSRALTASIFCHSPLRCAITAKHSTMALKQGTITAENKLSLLYIGGRSSCTAADQEGRRGNHSWPSCWEFSNPLTQLISGSLEKQPYSSSYTSSQGCLSPGNLICCGKLIMSL